jgi:hypothetical protein
MNRDLALRILAARDLDDAKRLAQDALARDIQPPDVERPICRGCGARFPDEGHRDRHEYRHGCIYDARLRLS